jgi:hypothetical protein
MSCLIYSQNLTIVNFFGGFMDSNSGNLVTGPGFVCFFHGPRSLNAEKSLLYGIRGESLVEYMYYLFKFSCLYVSLLGGERLLTWAISFTYILLLLCLWGSFWGNQNGKNA